MNTKAQVTEYIIIGVILVIIVAFLIYLSYSTNDDNVVENKIDTKSFQLFLDSCLETSSKVSLRELGQSGGYISVTNQNSIQNIAILTPQTLLSLEGRDSFTSQLEQSIENKIDECVSLGDSKLPITFTKGEPDIDISYDFNSVIIKLKFPINLQTDSGSESNIAEKTLNIPMRLRLFHLYVKDLINNHHGNPEFLIENNNTHLSSYLSQFHITTDNSTFSPYTLVSANSGDGFELLFLVE